MGLYHTADMRKDEEQLILIRVQLCRKEMSKSPTVVTRGIGSMVTLEARKSQHANMLTITLSLFILVFIICLCSAC